MQTIMKLVSGMEETAAGKRAFKNVKVIALKIPPLTR